MRKSLIAVDFNEKIRLFVPEIPRQERAFFSKLVFFLSSLLNLKSRLTGLRQAIFRKIEVKTLGDYLGNHRNF